MFNSGSQGKKLIKSSLSQTITNDYERLSIEQKKILLYLMDHERITRKEVAKLISSANTKSYEILTSLVEKQLISIFGKGRGTYYSLKKHL